MDLSKLTDVVKNEVVKKTEHNDLVEKVNNINTTDTSDLVKKPDYNTKINETEKKVTDRDHSNTYITTQKFNKITAKHFTARLNQANLATKADKTFFDDKLKSLN